MVYQFDPQQAPDDQFVPGELRHLVSGNEGRLLDPRRTPVRIVELDLPTGQFVVELLAFEDRGARWQMPLEHADRFQFARGCAEADAAEISRFEAIVARLDRPLAIAADPARRRDAEARLSSLREGAGEWLAANSEFLASGATPDFVGHTGAPALWRDLRAFMEAADLWDLEDAFAERYVRNPRSGELVKGHRIVIAELGLVAYDGEAIRDAELFAGRWSRERRAEHVLRRLAFVRELFAGLGVSSVTLHRGLSFDGSLEARGNETFVSTTFSSEIAESHFRSRDPSRTGLLIRQRVPIERVFMTHVETARMNEHYREAEAVLLVDPGNPLF